MMGRQWLERMKDGLRRITRSKEGGDMGLGKDFAWRPHVTAKRYLFR